MSPTDYTRLLQDYRYACDIIAEQKRQIEALRGACRMAHEYLDPDVGVVECRRRWGLGYGESTYDPLIKALGASLALGSTPPASGSAPVEHEDDGA